jgi:hypothetical protein
MAREKKEIEEYMGKAAPPPIRHSHAVRGGTIKIQGFLLLP